MKQKNKEGEFSSMVLGTLGDSLSRNLLTGKGKIRAGEETIEQAKEQLVQARISNATLSFN